MTAIHYQLRVRAWGKTAEVNSRRLTGDDHRSSTSSSGFDTPIHQYLYHEVDQRRDIGHRDNTPDSTLHQLVEQEVYCCSRRVPDM